MESQLAKRHRLGMWLPRQLVGWNAFEDAAGGRAFLLQLTQNRCDGHGRSPFWKAEILRALPQNSKPVPFALTHAKTNDGVSKAYLVSRQAFHWRGIHFASDGSLPASAPREE